MTTVQLALLPVLAAALWFGLGGLISYAAAGRAGGPLTRVLWVPLGLGLSMSLADGLSRLGVLAPLNVAIIVLLAAGGWWLQRRDLLGDRRTAAFAIGGALPITLVFSLIAITAGPVISGYLLDTNTGVHALGADHLLHDGGFGSVERTTSDQSMIYRFFVISTYPSGTHAEFGLLGALSGLSLLWVSTPLMGLGLAATALAAFAAARALGTDRLAAAFAGMLASCGALAVAFALSGQLKEITTLPVLTAASALALAPRGAGNWRGQAVVTAVICAALYSALGIPGLAWAIPLALWITGRLIIDGPADDTAAADEPTAASPEPVQRNPAPDNGDGRLATLRARIDLKGGLLALAVIAGLGAVLIAPLLPGIVDQLTLAKSLSSSNAALNADPGNLFGPIGKDRALGVWIASDHRTLLPYEPLRTGLLMGTVAVLVLVGVASLLRRRRWWALLWLGGMYALWVLLTQRGTMWLDSKLVVLSGPLVAVVAAAGLWELASLGGTRKRLQPLLAAALVAGPVAGVVLSGGMLLQYSGTSSQGLYEELGKIDARYAGKGPLIYTEFDEYANYTLRNAHVSAPGQAEKGGLSGVSRSGEGLGYGRSVDTDALPDSDLKLGPVVVTQRSPLRSAPGSAWKQVFQGSYVVAWQRDDARQAKVIKHIALSGKQGEALTAPSCKIVRGAAADARKAGGELVARTAPAPTKSLPIAADGMSANWRASFLASGSVNGDGRLFLELPAEGSGRARTLWLEGVVGRPLRVSDAANGKLLGTLPRRAGGEGNVVGPITVPAGVKGVTIASTPRQLRIGDRAPTIMHRFLLAPAEQPTQQVIAPADAEATLCGGKVGVDWIDVVRR